MSLTFLHGLGAVAERYGPEESIFLHLIVSLVRNNKANNRNFRDGRWWTYNSLSAWDAEFPWWSTKQIRRIITSCENQGALLIGEYNTDRRDRTAWYSPSDELLALYQEDWTDKCTCPNGQMHVPERADSRAQMGTTIPKESKVNQQNKINMCISELTGIFNNVHVSDDSRAANMEIVSLLEQQGYLCQLGVPVPARMPDKKYTGRIEIVATKDGVTTAIEIDRKSIREKSLYKLQEYACDIRIVLLRGGNAMEPPPGIDLVCPLKLKNIDDLFHQFWSQYPKKVNKVRAFETFRRLNITPELLSVILAALEVQKKSRQWQEAGGQYIPHASTWLNGKRWEDDISSVNDDASNGTTGSWDEDPEVM